MKNIVDDATSHSVDMLLFGANEALRAWYGTTSFHLDWDWLDEETFVVNFVRDNETALKNIEDYVEPTVERLGQAVIDIFNAHLEKHEKKMGYEWILHSERNYWDFDNEETDANDTHWRTTQAYIYLDYT